MFTGLMIGGSIVLWVLMLGITLLLCIYWAIKWVVSLWTGA